MPAAPPWFPFYPADFMIGTQGFTTEERGAYLLLLLYEWTTGDGIPGDNRARTAEIMNVSIRKVDRIWKLLGTKFRSDPYGKYFNARLEKERANQLAISAMQSHKGRNGAAVRWGKRHGTGNATAIAGVIPNRWPHDGLSEVRTSVQLATLSDPGTSISDVRGKEEPALPRRNFHSPVENDQNGPADARPPADRVAAAVRHLPHGSGRSGIDGGLEGADRGPADRAALPAAASGAVGSRDGRAAPSAAAVTTTAATAATGPPGSDDRPARAKRGDVDTGQRDGPSADDRERLRRIKAGIGDAPAAVHTGSRARRRSRSA